MKKIIQTSLILLLLSPLFIHAASPVHSQLYSLQISPPILEVMIKPGKYVTQTFILKNNGETTVITPLLLPYDGQNILAQSEKPDGWMDILNTDIILGSPFILKKDEERKIVLRIAPPQDMTDQDVYRALVFSSEIINDIDQNQSQMNQKVSSLILINITQSGRKKQAEISRFNTPLIMDSFGPLSFQVEIQNKGDTYFRPIGNISLIGPSLKAKYRISPRVIFANGKSTLIMENSLTNQQNSMVIPGFFIGKYQIEVKFTLDEGRMEVSQTKSIYAIPYKLLVTLLVMFYIINVISKLKKKPPK